MLASIILIGGCIWFISSLDTLLNKILLFIAVYLAGSYYLMRLGVYFIALSYIIVYIGAVAILFLFIIMISSTATPTTPTQVTILPVIALCLLLPTATNTGLITSKSWLADYVQFSDIQNLSVYIFNGWPLLVLLVGILLTSCLIGILEILGR